MTMPESTSVQPSIDAAMNAATPDEIISGVKGIVAREIEKLSSDVRIEYTDYFNHTYMPDMVLSWGSRQAEQRPIFLRNSLRLRPTLGDVEGLESRSPVVIGLKPADPDIGPRVRESVRRTRRVFVTDVSSIDVAGRQASSKDSVAPLLGIVRNNILRTGRGLMTVSDAEELLSATEDVMASDPIVADAALSRFESLTDSLLAEDGSYQVSRASRLLRAINDPDLLSEVLPSVSGRISETDLSIMLQYLFARETTAAPDGRFWETLATLVDLQDLERIQGIEDRDISPLASRAIDLWTGRRAELVYNSEFEPGGDRTGTVWFMRAGKLHAVIGPWKAVFVADDNRRLKGSVDAREANWDDISAIARSMVIESATLRGIVRRLTIDAEQSGNVIRDIDNITSTLDDSYRVQQLTARIVGTEGPGIEVDFRKMLTTTKGGTVPISELGTVALRFLGHRNPVDAAWFVGPGPDTPAR
ncbi:hypothetical protein [Nocardia nova]|uniref:hypothetical protein n=1 Tax=Nocardia nova TaxID=37330 RepID=UPI0011B00C3A|nr:hypothetical protein [Nocardia nova]